MVKKPIPITYISKVHIFIKSKNESNNDFDKIKKILNKKNINLTIQYENE